MNFILSPQDRDYYVFCETSWIWTSHGQNVFFNSGLHEVKNTIWWTTLLKNKYLFVKDNAAIFPTKVHADKKQGKIVFVFGEKAPFIIKKKCLGIILS